jgi:UDP-N-acetylglucosamine acyltransferase
MAYTHIAHDCILGDHIIISNASQLAGEVEVDDFAIIGGGSLIHQFCRLGKHVMIQGGALINKDIPPYVKAAREPIAFTGINSVGLRRRNFSEESMETIQEVYRLLYLSDMNVTDAVAHIKSEMPQSAERDEILNFIESSKRGIIRGH